MAARSVIGPRTDCVRFCLGDRVFLLLQRMDAEHQPGDTVALVELDHLIGQPDSLFDVAFRQDREERALQKFGIFRVAPERRAVIGGGSAGVALGAGMARGEIASRSGHARQLMRRGHVGGHLRCLARPPRAAKNGEAE